MRFSAGLSFVAPLAVSAALIDRGNNQQSFCSKESAVISKLKSTSIGTPYCSSYLCIPTSTVTSTTTVQPPCITTTTTTTVNGKTSLTSTSTVTVIATDAKYTTITSTTTETTSTTISTTTTLTCLDSAYTASSPTATPLVKRGSGSSVEKPKCIPANWSNGQISSACSCLSMPKKTTTIKVTSTKPAKTSTVTKTYVATPTTTVTTTEYSRTTTSITVTETATTTTTQSYAAAYTTIASNGVRYQLFDHSYTGETDDFDPNYFKLAGDIANGQTQNLNFGAPLWPEPPATIIFDDRAFDGTLKAAVMHGFFIAPQSGFYSFSIDGAELENWGYFWSGQKAYAWEGRDIDFRVYGPQYSNVGVAFRINAGDAIPVSYLWANGNGSGNSPFEVRLPDGTSVTDTTGYFVQACNPGVFQLGE